MAGPGRAVVLGGSAEDVGGGFSGWQVEARKARQGALLSPQGLSDGDLVGVRLPRSSVGGPVTPGRALLHLGDGRLARGPGAAGLTAQASPSSGSRSA